MEAYLNGQNKLKVQNTIFVTSKYATAGTVLLTQAPLTSVPLPSERLDRCNYCLRKGNLQCCSRCHSAYFCSHDCFLKAWIHFHRGLCNEKRQSENSLDVSEVLLERAALTIHSHAHYKNPSKPQSSSKPSKRLSFDAFHSLELQPDTQFPKEITDLFQKPSLLENTKLSANELSELWQRIQIASFPIMDPDTHLDPIAIGIYPITSQYVRHSCRPNAGLIYKQGYQLLVTLEDIPANTPVTISYVDLMATKKERDAKLMERFGFNFDCDCARCKGEFKGIDTLFERGEELQLDPQELRVTLEKQLKSWSVLDMIKEYAAKDFNESGSNGDQALDAPHLAHYICRMIAPDIYVPAFSKIGKKSAVALHYQTLPPLSSNYSYNRNTELKRILPAIDALLSNTPHSPFLTITGIKVAESLLTTLVAEGRWVEASRCTIYLFMVYRLVYPTLYPNMVYHTLFLSRASWNSLVQLELAGIGKKLETIYQNSVQLWIEVAKNSILKTFGQETALWREVVEIKWLFERDQKLKSL